MKVDNQARLEEEMDEFRLVILFEKDPEQREQSVEVKVAIFRNKLTYDWKQDSSNVNWLHPQRMDELEYWEMQYICAGLVHNDQKLQTISFVFDAFKTSCCVKEKSHWIWHWLIYESLKD